MKNQNKNRLQMLQQFVSKSHQVMDGIGRLAVHIQATYPSVDMHLDETPLFVPHNSTVHIME